MHYYESLMVLKKLAVQRLSHLRHSLSSIDNLQLSESELELVAQLGVMNVD